MNKTIPDSIKHEHTCDMCGSDTCCEHCSTGSRCERGKYNDLNKPSIWVRIKKWWSGK